MHNSTSGTYVWEIADGIAGNSGIFSVIKEIIKLGINGNKKTALDLTADITRISSMLTSSLIKIVKNSKYMEQLLSETNKN